MTTHVPWKSCVVVLLLSGCQSVDGFLPWQMTADNTLTEAELAALHSPQPAAATPELASELQPNEAGGVMTVSATASSTPVAAGRIEQLVRAGQAAIRDGRQGQPAKLQEATLHFQQVLQEDPQNASAHHGLAIVADLQHNWPAAEHHYKLALQQRSHDPSLLNDLGYSYILQNRFHEASKYLTQAIQIAPQHELAHINLALLSLKRGDRSGAEARLATIYTSSEINRTIARLQDDLQQTSNVAAATPAVEQPPTWGPVAGQQQVVNGQQSGAISQQQFAAGPAQPIHGSYPHGVPVNGAFPNGTAANGTAANAAYGNAAQTFPQQQPQPWQAPGLHQQQTVAHSAAHLPVNGSTSGAQTGYANANQAPAGSFATGTGAAQPIRTAAANTPATTDRRPISIYPPGVQPDSAMNPALTSAAAYNGTGAPVNTASQTQVTGNFGNPTSGGTVVGGVIAAPATSATIPNANLNYGNVPAAGQQSPMGSAAYGQSAGAATQSQPLLQQPHGAFNNATRLQAPIQGLNAGPGTLFPVTVPQSNNGIPDMPQNPVGQPYYGGATLPPQANGGYPAGGSAYPGNVTTVSVQQPAAQPGMSTGSIQAPNPAAGGLQRMENYQLQIQQQQAAPLNQSLQQYAGQRPMMMQQ